MIHFFRKDNQKRYTFDACKSRPCSLGSFCEKLENGRFLCHCPLGKQGVLCEKGSKLLQNLFFFSFLFLSRIFLLKEHRFMFPQFKQFSYLKLLPIEVRLDDLSIEIEFQPTSANGIIFHLHDAIHHDFIAVFLRSGFVEMRYFVNSNS